MKTITFQYKNSDDLLLLLLLAKRMGIQPIDPLPANPDKGIKMGEALQKLAQINAFAHIADPVKWQRQTRKDRKLPGR